MWRCVADAVANATWPLLNDRHWATWGALETGEGTAGAGCRDESPRRQ